MPKFVLLADEIHTQGQTYSKDMIMPKMSGGETYDKMKRIDSNVKVLLSSGYSIDREAAEIIKRGCNSFIQKPFSIKDLSVKIDEVLDN
jgi:two-component system cell cycle sensor histidine kinase/response regulator CckA